MTTPTARPNDSSTGPARSGLVRAALILVATVANLNLSVANVALPEIALHFDAGQIAINLVAVGYSLGLAASVLWLGAVGDRYGRRNMLLIGTVLVPGAATPKLVTREMVASMKQGAVIVDISADQGGCCETTRPTSHSDPTYVVDGVTHYCVTNMPGAVPRTSTFALNNATLPFVLALAGKGWRKAMQDDPHLRAGLNVHGGKIVCPAVAQAQGVEAGAVEGL